MARIAFLSVYNPVALGIRQLAGILEAKGHEVGQFFLKHGSTAFPALDLPGQDNLEHGGGHEFSICLQSTRLATYNHKCNPIKEAEIELFCRALEEYAPDVIGLSATNYLESVVLPLISRIKERFPGIPFIAGGYGPTFSPETFAHVFDLVFLGEAEESILDFMDRLQSGAGYAGMAGVAFLRDGQLVRSGLRAPLCDLDPLPFPVYREGRFISVEDGALHSGDPIGDTYYTMWGRGCPGKCSYCSTSVLEQLYRSEGHHLPGRRLRSIERTMQELERARDLGFRRVFFEDSYFVADKDLLLEFFSAYGQRVGIAFFVYFHYTQITRHPELVDAAVAAGLWHTVCGVQHAGERFAQKEFCRNVPSRYIKAAAQMFLDRKILFNYDFITDTPIESEEDFEDQLASIPEYPFSPNYTQIGISKLRSFPGTPLTRRIEEAAERPAFSKVPWLYKAALIAARFYADDRSFKAIRESRYFREDPAALVALLPRLCAGKFIQTREPCLSEDFEVLKLIYHYHADKLAEQPILIWGTGQRYRDLVHLFGRNQILACFDNDPKRRGTKVDGIEVHGPEALTRFPGVPLFICSVWKPDILRQIRAAHGDAFPIP
jgi:radical SAM superfamily enzyme YgiQ (UPF0313 family)